MFTGILKTEKQGNLNRFLKKLLKEKAEKSRIEIELKFKVL